MSENGELWKEMYPASDQRSQEGFAIFAQGFGQEIKNLVSDERLDLGGDGSIALNDFLILVKQTGQ